MSIGSLSGSVVDAKNMLLLFQNENESENKFHGQTKTFLPASGLLDDDDGSLSGSINLKIFILISMELTSFWEEQKQR